MYVQLQIRLERSRRKAQHFRECIPTQKTSTLSWAEINSEAFERGGSSQVGSYVPTPMVDVMNPTHGSGSFSAAIVGLYNKIAKSCR